MIVLKIKTDQTYFESCGKKFFVLLAIPDSPKRNAKYILFAHIFVKLTILFYIISVTSRKGYLFL